MSRLGPCRARISGDRHTDRHTHTHTHTHKASTITLAAHARRGLTRHTYTYTHRHTYIHIIHNMTKQHFKDVGIAEQQKVREQDTNKRTAKSKETR